MQSHQEINYRIQNINFLKYKNTREENGKQEN
jgi:hypothetical protein